jgi:hypothetical protein
MGLITTHPIQSLATQLRASEEMPAEGQALLPCKNEAPDPMYWTAYDYHMIQRDARVLRRAYVYSMMATLWKRLSQHIFGSQVTA